MSGTNDFSVDGFSQWFKNNKDEPSFEIKRNKKYELIGMEVVSRLSTDRLAHKMTAIDGNCDQLTLEFIENGGCINEVKGKEFVIEVDSGLFSIKRCYTKLKEDI